MTKTLKSGEDKFTTTDGKHVWEGQELEVKSDPLVDSGTGTAVIIRVFEFEANPETLKRMKPTKQELFNAHAGQIKMMLWGDGLETFEGVEPKIVTSKKVDKYRIYVACKARPGIAVNETLKTLQELIHN